MNRLFFANLIPGTVLYSRFRLLRCLSAADTCGVYLCMSLDDEALYALKIFQNDTHTPKAGKESLRREYDLSSRVRHPNVLSSAGLYEDEDFSAFTMPYLSGGSLADLLEEKKTWRSRDVIDLLMGVSEGLVALHEAGILHRDLKPENILLDDADKPLIADFGIGEAISESEEPGRKFLIGTPEYWSPEYISTGVFDARSDIYAIGVIGYELLTCELPPLVNISVGGLSIKIRKPVSILLPKNYPSMLTKIIEKCLEENPEDRFQSAVELRDMLCALKDWEDLANVEEKAANLLYRRTNIERITGNAVPLHNKTLRLRCDALSSAVNL